MPTQTISSQDKIERAIDAVLASRTITREDQNLIMSLLFDNAGAIAPETVERFYDALHRGTIRAID